MSTLLKEFLYLLQTLLTPLANLLMDWDELQISYLYVGCSVEVNLKVSSHLA